MAWCSENHAAAYTGAESDPSDVDDPCDVTGCVSGQRTNRPNPKREGGLAYVDRGYRGHDAERHRVFISRQKRGITPTIRRELRRRNAVEPLIGHMKSDGHLDRNFLLGRDGDAIYALLAAAGHNLRLLRRRLAQLFAVLLAAMQGAVRTPAAGLTNAAA